jgi:hypothetical protein
MSIRIALDNAPDFFTNLDLVRGRIVLHTSKHEQVGAIIAKLEGESKTALTLPPGSTPEGQTQSGPGGSIIAENHKILYKVSQVFPPEGTAAIAQPLILAPGQHEFPFKFKLPFNNICGDPKAMAKIGGYAGSGGYGAGPAFLGMGGIRVMDGSRQLMYKHVRKTLPPSFTGAPRQAEIRYYIKVTIQRPGLLKENWRYQTGFRFMPIEPPRPRPTGQEAYARRPFTFKPRNANANAPGQKRRSSLFERRSSEGGPSTVNTPTSPSGRTGYDTRLLPPSFNAEKPPPSPGTNGNGSANATDKGAASESYGALQPNLPPSVEMSARLPHPSILTCNQPIPLRLIAKKLAPSRETVFLTAFQIDLIGTTHVRCQDMVNNEVSRWVVTGRHQLSIAISNSSDPVGTETAINETMWKDVPLPNTVMPSFVTCNLARTYELEIKLSISWGLPQKDSSSGGGFSSLFSRKGSSTTSGFDLTTGVAQTIHLPLHFSKVEVYSGLAPPEQLVEAMRRQQAQDDADVNSLARPRPTGAFPFQLNTLNPNHPSNPLNPHSTNPSAANTNPLSSMGPQTPSSTGGASAPGPALPPRHPQQAVQDVEHADPLYPPQLRPGQNASGGPGAGEAPPYDEAPPSYDEAMAEEMAAPPTERRPGYSGVTDVNAPDSIPEKR